MASSLMEKIKAAAEAVGSAAPSGDSSQSSEESIEIVRQSSESIQGQAKSGC